MKVFILGLGKTGTTALLYKVAGGLPNCQAFSGGKPGKYVGNYENAVYKHTYSERKGKDFDLFREHLAKESYDRKIWTARDPRDAAVSEMLFRWHRGYMGRKDQYEAHLRLVLQKEKDPKSVPFYEICRHAAHAKAWPISKDQLFEDVRQRYLELSQFVQGLGPDWYLFKYEDMVGGNFDSLVQYLGFPVQAEGEVPKAYGKVVRKKGIGDWRAWFTPEDVEFYKPAFRPYMETIGYDLEDWALDENPVIDPKFSSEYMQSLPKRVAGDTVRRYLGRVWSRLVG